MVTGVEKISMRKIDKTIKILMQTGHSKSIPRDKGRSAKLPGKRISKTGKIYWETRQNRSDEALSNV